MTGQRVRAAWVVLALAGVLCAWTGEGEPIVSAQDTPLPYELRLVAQLGAPATEAVGAGDTVYAILGASVAAIDVSAPEAPAVLGEPLPVEGRVRAMAHADGLLVLAQGGLGLRVVDVAEPSRLRGRGRLATNGDAVGVAMDGGLAYVADAADGLVVVDLADPDRPVVVGRSRSHRAVLGVAVHAGRAYLAERDAWEEIVRLIDVSEPARPRDLSFVDVPGVGLRMAATQRALYVLVEDTTVSSHVRVVDVSDPMRPRLARAGGSGRAAQGRPVGGRAEESRPGQSPIQTPGQATRAAAAATAARSLALGDGRLVVGYGTIVGMHSIEADPHKPAQTGTWTVPSGAFGVAVRGDVAIVAAGAAGVVVGDLSKQPAEPIGSLVEWSLGQPTAVDWQGDRLYVADGLGALRVYDLADPSEPRLLVHWPTRSVPQDVDALGDYAIVAQALATRREGTRVEYAGGLEIVHLGDPSAPFLAAEANKICAIPALDLEGTRAYLTESVCSGRQRSVVALDLTRPWWPEELGAVTLQVYSPSDIEVRGAKAYVTDSGYGTAMQGALWTVDFGGEKPAPLAKVSLPGAPMAVDLAGRYALVALGAGGLALVDVGDPAAPALVRHYAAGPSVHDVTVSGGLAWLARGYDGVHVWDVSVPTLPRTVALADTPAFAGRLAMGQGRCAVAMPEGMIQVFELVARPTATPSPTPTASATTRPSATPTSDAQSTPPDGGRAIYLPSARAESGLPASTQRGGRR